jgi:hypothetical protein
MLALCFFFFDWLALCFQNVKLDIPLQQLCFLVRPTIKNIFVLLFLGSLVEIPNSMDFDYVISNFVQSLEKRPFSKTFAHCQPCG